MGIAAKPKKPLRRLILIPWHIGNPADLTINSVRTARRLRYILAEDPEVSRWQFQQILGSGVATKIFLRLPEDPAPAFRSKVLGLLTQEDVGLVSDGGVPCFVDPGAWLVRELRQRGVPIVPLAGPSALSTLLSMSGVTWSCTTHFTFVFFAEFEASKERRAIRRALGRCNEAIVVYLLVDRLAACLRVLATFADARPVSIFFDLTKAPKEQFPYADQVRTLTAKQWLRRYPDVRWNAVSDVALLVHPRPPRRAGGARAMQRNRSI
jgi:16S rRNA (cytidine1402-2'-O)-methyltransferase